MDDEFKQLTSLVEKIKCEDPNEIFLFIKEKLAVVIEVDDYKSS